MRNSTDASVSLLDLKSPSKRENNAVNIFRFICSILIIINHTKPFETIFLLDSACRLLVRFAVPYFFTSSSFFVFTKLIKTESIQQKKVYLSYVKRLFKFYIIWFLINSVISISRGHVNNITYYVKQFIIPTSGSPLWFLPALIFASFAVFSMVNIIKMKPKTVFILALPFLVFGYCISTIAGAFSESETFQIIRNNIYPIIGIKNGLFYAFTYVALGCVMAYSNIEKRLKRDIILVVLSFVLLGVEALFNVLVLKAELTSLWIFSLPLTYFTMRCTLTLESPSGFNYNLLRKMGNLNYVIHPILIIYIRDFISYIGIADRYNLVYFSITTIFAISFIFVLIKLSGHQKMRFLKHFM